MGSQRSITPQFKTTKPLNWGFNLTVVQLVEEAEKLPIQCIAQLETEARNLTIAEWDREARKLTIAYLEEQAIFS